jgi:hypothetical protein
LRRYYDTGQAGRDTYLERKARTKDALDELLRTLNNNVPEQQRDMILDHFAEALAETKSPE